MSQIKPKGKYDGYWEMREGGPYDAGDPVFKCTGCNTVTEMDKDWNGEPKPGRCKKGCPNHEHATTDWRPGAVSRSYAANYAAVFGHD
jgi:hypothetical protein